MVLFCFLCSDTYTLPGIVDGARNKSQSGKRVLGGAWGRDTRSFPQPMRKAANSRDQRMEVVTSVMHDGVGGEEPGERQWN